MTAPETTTTVAPETPVTTSPETNRGGPERYADGKLKFVEQANPVRKVPKDWKPKSLEDSISFQFGEIQHEDDGSTAETKTEAKPEAKSETKPEAKRQQSDAPEVTAEMSDEELSAHVDSVAKETGMSKAQREAFKNKTEGVRRFKRELKDTTTQLEQARAAAAEVETLRQQIAELQKAPKGNPDTDALLKTLQEERDALKESHAKLEDIVAASNVERSERFQKEIAEPLGAIENVARELASRYELKEGDVLSALRMPPGKDRSEALNALTDEMKQYDAAEFAGAARDYAILSAQKEQILQNARQNWEQMSQAERARAEQERLQQEQQTAEQRAEWDRHVEPKWKEILEKTGLKESIDGNDRYNEVASSAAQFAKTVQFGELAVASQVEAMHRAAVFPLLLGKNRALEDQVKSLEERVAKYESGTPGAGSGARPAAAAKTETPKTRGESMVEGVNQAIADAVRDGRLPEGWS